MSTLTGFRVQHSWLALLLLAGACECVYALSLPLPEFVALVPDDSFFYLRIAREFVAQGRFSFGPGDETYGFQPLWQLVLIALGHAIADPSHLMRATLALCIVLRTATGIGLFVLGRELWSTAAGVVASAAWSLNTAIAVWSWGLKENTLYALLLVLSFLCLLRLLRCGATPARAIVLGLALGLATLARVNAVVVVGLVLATLALAPGRDARRARWWPACLAGGVALAVALPWYVFAQVHFGTALPTSGVWKEKIGRAAVELVWQIGWWSPEHVARGLAETAGYLRRTLAHGFGPFEFVLVGAGVTALLSLAWPAGRRPWGKGRGAWTVPCCLALATVIAAWLNAMVLRPFLDFGTWYTVPEYVAYALAFGCFGGRALALASRTLGRVVLASALVAALAAWPAERWREHGWVGNTLPRGMLTHAPAASQTLEIGLWAARHVPDDVTLAMFDPGAITYFSGKRVVSLDPLMNSLAFQEHDVGNPVGYCKRMGAGYVIGSGTRIASRYTMRGLPPDSYDVLWVPFPDHPLPWGSDPVVFAMLVRLHDVPAAEFVTPDILPCGLYRPHDVRQPLPAEAAEVRSLEHGDALRLRVAADECGQWSLVVDGHAPVVSGCDAAGWAFFDLRPCRGLRPRLRWNGGDTMPALIEAYVVDFTFPVR